MPARPPSRRSAAAGSTLAEVTVAVLVVAFLSVPVMALLLSARMSDGRHERRLAAASAMRRLSETLKTYVTADPALVPGPGAGHDGWSLPGDLRGGYALAAGVHQLDPKLWAAELSSHSAFIRYAVTNAATPAGPQASVSFTLSWREP